MIQMQRLKNWHKRAIILAISFIFISAGIVMSLKIFSENIIFYVTPNDLHNNPQKYSYKLIRLGGVVKTGSIKNLNSINSVEFIITDLKQEVLVQYKGLIPALFKEESGVVVQGYFKNNIFYATELLTKHDESYMPKEVVDALKKSGKWKHSSIKRPEDDPELLDKPPYSIM